MTSTFEPRGAKFAHCSADGNKFLYFQCSLRGLIKKVTPSKHSSVASIQHISWRQRKKCDRSSVF